MFDLTSFIKNELGLNIDEFSELLGISKEEILKMDCEENNLSLNNAMLIYKKTGIPPEKLFEISQDDNINYEHQNEKLHEAVLNSKKAYSKIFENTNIQKNVNFKKENLLFNLVQKKYYYLDRFRFKIELLLSKNNIQKVLNKKQFNILNIKYIQIYFNNIVCNIAFEIIKEYSKYINKYFNNYIYLYNSVFDDFNFSAKIIDFNAIKIFNKSLSSYFNKGAFSDEKVIEIYSRKKYINISNFDLFFDRKSRIYRTLIESKTKIINTFEKALNTFVNDTETSFKYGVSNIENEWQNYLNSLDLINKIDYKQKNDAI